MNGETGRVVLSTSRPQTWPDLPREMSFSLLKELECCPLRWALTSADYPDVWSRRGYPHKIQISALTGIVVHRVVQLVISALVRAGCRSVGTPEAIDTMKELGGYTMLLTKSIDDVLKQYADNPRAKHLVGYATRTLRAQTADMRTQVQGILIRIDLGTAQRGAFGPRGTPVGQSVRSALGPGTYPELDVHVPKLNWKGKIDLLTLSEKKCEIVDFKTGKPSDEHRFQVLVYALLWNRDLKLNPEGRLADRILLSYRSGDVPVNAPSLAELDEIERTLIDRTKAARAAATLTPPKALPDNRNCDYCDVRQNCDIYWRPDVHQKLLETKGETQFFDLELMVVGRHGPASWDSIVSSGIPQLVGKKVVLRAPPDSPEYMPKVRLRILDAHVAMPEADGAPAIVTLGTFSESFLNKE